MSAGVDGEGDARAGENGAVAMSTGASEERRWDVVLALFGRIERELAAVLASRHHRREIQRLVFVASDAGR